MRDPTTPSYDVSVLLISSKPDTRDELSRILTTCNCDLQHATTRRDWAASAANEAPTVVICEAQIADCDWKQILQDYRSLSEPPSLIVTSPHADEMLWAEVLNLGGYDVLEQPFDPDEVHRVVMSAWQHSPRRYRGQPSFEGAGDS